MSLSSRPKPAARCGRSDCRILCKLDTGLNWVICSVLSVLPFDNQSATIQVSGKPASSITLANSKTLHDASGVIRSLARRHERPWLCGLWKQVHIVFGLSGSERLCGRARGFLVIRIDRTVVGSVIWHACSRTDIHAHIRTYIHTCTHGYMRPHTHGTTETHTYIYIYIYIYMHRHKCAHACIISNVQKWLEASSFRCTQNFS